MTTVNNVLERLMGRTQPKEKPLSDKMVALQKSIAEVQKYELLTTNQYIQQMDLILSILVELQTHADEQEHPEQFPSGNEPSHAIGMGSSSFLRRLYTRHPLYQA